MTINVYPPYGSSNDNPIYVAFDGTNTDAFGRLRVSNPVTLFDGQARFAADTAYSYVTATGGTTSYNTNQSSVNLNVTTTSGSTAVAQTYRVFPYQPGKGLLTLQTFTMASAKTNLRQRVGYFSAYNGVYLEQGPNGVTFVIRTYTSGSVDDSRYVAQANWNGDKLNGTGPSGLTLDLTKTQILWIDFEWLGVGNVRCGFVINGQYIVCHTFQNANQSTSTTVYMQTAILPLRYEISNTGSTSGSSILQMICSSVISEGGYEQTSQPYIARTGGNGITIANNTGLTFTPIVSIRVNSSYYGAIIIPDSILFNPTSSGSTGYEVTLIKNASLSNATWAANSISSGMVDVDIAATSCTATADNIVQSSFANQSSQGVSSAVVATGYNFDLQLGYTASLSGNGFASSDTYTLAARGLNNSPTGSGTGSISFYNLTV
jgi:hypothetical protein